MKPTSAAVDATRLLHPSGPGKLTRDAGGVVDIGSTCVRLMVRGPETRGGFALIEYPIQPRTLVAPLHRHTWEDEYSFVLEGRIAVLLGEALRARGTEALGPGELGARYGLETDFESVPRLCAEHGLQRPRRDPSMFQSAIWP